MRRFVQIFSSLLIWLLLCGSALAMGDHGPPAEPVLTITGDVTNPLKLTVAELSRLQSVEIQLNEVDRDRQFHGVYLHQAVPLRTLLDMAEVITRDQPTRKGIELAIRITGASGKQVVLSWGEVYYSNAAEYAIAFAATSVKPMMTEARCQKCHGPEVYKSVLDRYQQPAKLPKLLVKGDFYTDRCVEEVTRIEVLDLYPKRKTDRSVKLQSSELKVTGLVAKELKLANLKDYPQMKMWKKVVGLHMGYHGLHLYEGVSLAKVLESAGVGDELTKAVMISAPDGYRALFSFGELFQSFKGRRIMLAESVDGKPLEGQRGGKYRIIVPEELVDDRDVLAVDRIEIIDLKPQAKISIIGVGPGDTDLLTLEALSALARADVLVAPADITRRFSSYLGNKPNLFDPLLLIKHIYRKAHPELSAEELAKQVDAERKAGVAKIRQALDAGKNVAFLDWGDPLIYGSSRWIRHYFSDAELETVAALSSFNVANAMIQRDIGAGGSIAITMPSGLKEHPQLLEAVAESGDTLAIFMGLKEFQALKPQFDRYYAADTPVALVFSAGVAGRERLVRTTLKQVVDELKADPEKFLGLIYMGPRLNQRSSECQ